MSDILTLLNAARSRAVKGGLPTRRKDRALYGLLSGCLFICEKVQREGLEDQLREAVRVTVDERNPDLVGQGRSGGNNGKGRRYAERDSDAYVLVCRYVLAGTENRTALSRYSSSMRQAALRQIGSGELVDWLTDNGGVRALYMARPVVTSKMERRTLHLNQPVQFVKGETFTVQLRYDGKGYFDVME